MQISKQLSVLNISGADIASAASSFTVPAFSPPTPAIRTNTLWFTSLVLSLTSASFAILVKQWLREYLSGRYTSPQERIRIRHYRWEGLHRWRVFEIASALPILLQIALILFFVGLSDFLRQLDSIVGLVVSALIALWLLLLAIGTLTPAVSYRCPYKVPFLKNITRGTRLFFSLLLRKRSKRDLSAYSLFPGDERGVRRDMRLDVPAMVEADKLYGDDDFLEKTLRPCIQDVDGQDVVRFVRGAVGHRLDRDIRTLTRVSDRDLGHLTTKALYTTMYMVIDALDIALDAQGATLTMWMHEALVYLFTALNHSHLRQRPIGSAMNNGLHLQRKLLVGDISIMRECLVLLTRYPYVRCVMAPGIDESSERFTSSLFTSL